MAPELVAAVQSGNLADIAALLAASGGNVNSLWLAVPDEPPRPLLSWAAMKGKTDVVKALISEHGAEPGVANPDGETPLHCAAYFGHVDAALALLATGRLDVNATEEGQTALMYACADQGNLEMARALLRAGADPNQAMPNGATPLRLAAGRGHLDIVKLLAQDSGADLTAEASMPFGKTTAERAAVVRRHTAIVDVLRLSSPSIKRLAQECKRRFDARMNPPGAEHRRPVLHAQAHANRVAATIVQEVIRERYKAELKTGNKDYDLLEQPSQEKALRRQQNSLESSRTLTELRGRRARLEDYVTAGIGNCGELARLAATLARSLGVPANLYRVGAERAPNPHTVCVIGPDATGNACSATGRVADPACFVVDPWANICTPVEDYEAAFRAKMGKWAGEGKLVDHTASHDQPFTPWRPDEFAESIWQPLMKMDGEP